MRSKYKVLRYTPNDKMSDLICDNYTMLFILNRFGIDMGFKELTIAEVCDNYQIDVSTFLAIVNLLISKDKKGVYTDSISLNSLLDYLYKSHAYFLDYKLPNIRKRLLKAIPGSDALSIAALNYYDEYIAEVRKHMEYEENTVFKYVNNLLAGKSDNKFYIDMFSDHHEGMESKLTELKNIIIKYYPVASTNELSSVLFDIFSCESDLLSHSEIEDYILIPAIRAVEKEQRG
ncbi:MAG: hemerythrin domain-containing protein [Bacteroidales bacterium]